MITRGKRNRIIQSQDEYISEEHTEQQRISQQDIGSSELQLGLGENFSDGDDDVEINVQEENGEIRRRGRNKLKDIWGLPRGHRIVVGCNDLDQPIGDETGVLGKFLGMIARNGCLCSLSYRDWRLLVGKRERNSNEQKNKLDILKQVKARTLHFQDVVSLDQNKKNNTNKVADVETTSFWSAPVTREIIPQKEPIYAAKHANKQQHGTSSRLRTNAMAAGTSVFLKSLKNQSKKVAVATVQSCDPTQKLDGVAIGNQFWLVRVSIVIEDDEVLVRPYKSYRFMGDAPGAYIAWPVTLIEKANW